MALLYEPSIEIDRMPEGHPLLEAEGVFSLEAYDAQQVAAGALDGYPVVVDRRKTVGEPIITDSYEIHEEVVYFSDGAIRRLTRAAPNFRWFGEDRVSPLPVIGTDALGTGPSGINAETIKSLVESGYPVEWLHHQGRDATWPTSWAKMKRLGHFLFGKSVGRSAHHEHVLLNDLAINGGVEYDTDNVVSIGDSRGANTGEAVDATAHLYERNVIFGDYFAECFNHRPDVGELLKLGLVPVTEAIALGKFTIDTLKKDIREGNLGHSAKLLGTLDLHPMNLLHEAAWILPLVNGDVGKYAAAVPLDSHGVRTLLKDDKMSQHEAWQATHADRPNVHFFILPGSHLDLAREEVQKMRIQRLQRLLEEMHSHNFQLPYIDFNYVVFGKAELAVA